MMSWSCWRDSSPALARGLLERAVLFGGALWLNGHVGMPVQETIVLHIMVAPNVSRSSRWPKEEDDAVACQDRARVWRPKRVQCDVVKQHLRQIAEWRCSTFRRMRKGRCEQWSDA